MAMPYFILKCTVIVHLTHFYFFAAINHTVMNTVLAGFFSKSVTICLFLVSGNVRSKDMCNF